MVCFQVTFQASSIDEGRFLYDQLTALCPILVSFYNFFPPFFSTFSFFSSLFGKFFADEKISHSLLLYLSMTLICRQLSISAAAPIFRGLLADVDCRWDVISGSVDDRTDEEKGNAVRIDFVVTSLVYRCGRSVCMSKTDGGRLMRTYGWTFLCAASSSCSPSRHLASISRSRGTTLSTATFPPGARATTTWNWWWMRTSWRKWWNPVGNWNFLPFFQIFF